MVVVFSGVIIMIYSMTSCITIAMQYSISDLKEAPFEALQGRLQGGRGEHQLERELLQALRDPEGPTLGAERHDQVRPAQQRPRDDLHVV